MRILISLILVLMAFPLSAFETLCITRYGDGASDYEDGLVKADFVFEYLVDGVPTADPGITVTQIGSNGTYLIGGLPDHESSSDPQRVIVAVTPGPDPTKDDSTICIERWPGAPPRVGQSLEWRPTYSLDSGRTIGEGDLGADIRLTVSSFSEDPSGNTVDFSMWCKGSLVVDAQPASIVAGSAVEGSGGYWQAQFLYQTQAGDTDTPARCIAKFRLDPGGSDQLTLPPGSTIKIDILEFAP